MSQPEPASSLEKARAWYQRNRHKSEGRWDQFEGRYDNVAMLAAHADSAVALEREQRDKEWIAQLMKMRAGYDHGETVWVELIDPPDRSARGERKEEENG